MIETAGSLRIKPRDMVKIGVTFLNGGTGNSEPIVSEAWVEKSAESFPENDGINIPGEASGIFGYSYTWWIKEYMIKGRKVHLFSASGWGGQHIMVIPQFSIVVVFTCGNYKPFKTPYKVLKKYVFPAID